MPNDSLPPFPCPVCDNCDHDLRAGVLELITNIKSNIDAAAEELLDAMEADGDGAAEFFIALQSFASVRAQIGAVLDTIPDIAVIKSVHAE